VEQIAVSIIDKLPSGYIQAIVTAAVVLYLWLCARARSPWPFRKDKKGNIYLYSHGYELAKGRGKETQALLKDIREALVKVEKDVIGHDGALQSLQRSVLRTELLLNIHNTPEKVEIIMGLAHKYFDDLKGNEYMTDVYKEWHESVAKRIIKERV
jgi:hypothetical protein